MALIDWDLAGMTNGEREISKRIPPGSVLIPPVIKLEGDYLVYGGKFQKYRYVEPSDTLLNSFVKLANAPGEKILRFAKKHGRLDLNEGNHPGQSHTSGREPIKVWRVWASIFRSLLNVAAALRMGKMGDPQDWEVLRVIPSGADGLPLGREDAELRVTEGCEDLGLSLETGLTFELVCTGTERVWRLEIALQASMYNALLLQLMLAIAGSDLFICDGCQYPYSRPKTKKRPRAGCANFCDDCGRPEALRQANRRRKQKMAEARRLHAEGVAAGEIAKRLDTKPATVRGWVKKAR